MLILFYFDQIMSIEDLKKALDSSTFKFLDIFSAIYNQQKKAIKDINKVSLHHLCEKNTKLENCQFWGISETLKNQQFV
jgi:hypothetical protein